MPLPNRIRAVVWRPLVVCPQADLQRRLRGVLTELAVEQPCTVAEYPAPGAIAALLERHACNLCFLDAATDAERAELLISELAPAVPVVALHPRNDADLILRCLRRGASEFLADPALHAPGTVYCVVPGKPGCGASTLAVHLAVQLRAGAGPVLLVDGDHLTASVAFQLRLKPEFHLEDVQRDWARMDDDLWSRLTVQVLGLDILAAPDDPTTHTTVSRQFAAELCAFWRERYEAVVLDMPDVGAAVDCGFAAGNELIVRYLEHVRVEKRLAARTVELYALDLSKLCGFAAQADNVLLVTSNELAALHAAGRCLRYLDAAAVDKAKVRLIVNRYAPAIGLPLEDLKAALSVEPFAVLSNDYQTIQTALLNGKPAPAASRFGAGVLALYRQLSQRGAPDQKNPSWLASLLHRK